MYSRGEKGGLAYNSKERKRVIESIHSVTGKPSIAFILPFAGRFCRAGDLFVFLLVLRQLRGIYGKMAFSAIVSLFVAESLESRIGFFWAKLFYEFDELHRDAFLSLVRGGFIERTDFPLTLSHVLPPNVKPFKLSAKGKEALLLFRTEVKRLTKGKAKHKIQLSERLI